MLKSVAPAEEPLMRDVIENARIFADDLRRLIEEMAEDASE